MEYETSSACRVPCRRVTALVGIVGYVAIMVLSRADAASIPDGTLGQIVADRATVDVISFSVPVEGTLDDRATAIVDYRESGPSAWRLGPELLRVRPEDAAATRADSFSGALWDLMSGKDYDIRVTVTVPDGSQQTLTSSVSTRRIAPESSSVVADHVLTPGMTHEEIQALFDSAEPGDIFEFRGIHFIEGLTMSGDGLEGNPIVIRGDNRETAILGDRSGAALTISGDYVVVEDLTLHGSLSSRVLGAIRVRGTSGAPQTGFTLRRCILSARRGIRLWEGSDGALFDATIYDNVIQGKWSWSDIVSLRSGGTAQGEAGIDSTWNDDGIKITGQGHSVFHNTFAGFGDTVKVHRDSSVPNIVIGITRNLVLWGGDDAFELDDGFKAVVAYQNMVMNTGTLGSRQPNTVTGGPTYFVGNIGVNQFLRPWKLNDEPSGIRIVHNTLVATINSLGDPKETIWTQFQAAVNNAWILNNLWVHTNSASIEFDGLVKFTAASTGAEFRRSEWDGSAWYPDGKLEWSDGTYPGLDAARAGVDNVGGYDGALFESQGIVLSSFPFANEDTSSLGSDWTFRVGEFDARLSESSAASSGAIPLSGYNELSTLSRGALQLGAAPVRFGERSGFRLVSPKPPTNLTTD